MKTWSWQGQLTVSPMLKESQTPLYMIQYGQLQLYLAKHANFGWYIQFSKAGFFNLEIGPKLFFQPTVKTFSSLHSPTPPPQKGEARLKPKATDHVAD